MFDVASSGAPVQEEATERLRNTENETWKSPAE